MISENEDKLTKSNEKAEEDIETSQAKESILKNTKDIEDDSYYEELLISDMNELSEQFSDGSGIKITDLKNPLRYGALRDLGLTPKEAYLASGGRKEKADNRAHLSSSVPRKTVSSFSEMPRAELDAAREIFGDISDSEIRNLYRKVTQ